jgi:hypothetical protein
MCLAWRGAELVGTMAATLRVLRVEFAAVFRPHLEPCVAAVAAVLARCETVNAHTEEQQSWRRVAAELMTMLTRIVTMHPNPRKVFATVVPRLLQPLLSAAAVHGDPSAASARE